MRGIDGRHHPHESEQALGVSDEQGSVMVRAHRLEKDCQT